MNFITRPKLHPQERLYRRRRAKSEGKKEEKQGWESSNPGNADNYLTVLVFRSDLMKCTGVWVVVGL